jgi:ubiquinone/menaquinone biosynthesis C-methylase UbiE
LGLSSTDIVADIGCGIGYFTIPATEMINSENKVYALDTSEEMLAEVEKRASFANVTNIVTIKTSEYDLTLPGESITFALLVNILHEIEDKMKFIREVKRILRKEGKLAIIEWEKEDMEKGPSVDQRIGKDEVSSMLKGVGFEIGNSFKFAGIFYGLIAIKNKE